VAAEPVAAEHVAVEPDAADPGPDTTAAEEGSSPGGAVETATDDADREPVGVAAGAEAPVKRSPKKATADEVAT
jgi:hypothetical protein